MNGTGEKNDNWPGENEPVPAASFADEVGLPAGQIGPCKLLSILGEGGGRPTILRNRIRQGRHYH